MKNLTYRIVLRKESEGGYTVFVPALPGCITYGKDLDDVNKMAKEAIMVYIESLHKHREHIPDDSQTFETVLNLQYA